MSELYELSAVDTLQAFRDGSVSPSDYLEANFAKSVSLLELSTLSGVERS